MSFDLQQFQPGGAFLQRDSKWAVRTISRGHAVKSVRSSEVHDETDLVLDKIEEVTVVGGQTMAAVVRLAQAQVQMEVLAPAASGRLAYLAETHALIMGDLQADHARTMRRK